MTQSKKNSDAKNSQSSTKAILAVVVAMVLGGIALSQILGDSGAKKTSHVGDVPVENEATAVPAPNAKSTKMRSQSQVFQLEYQAVGEYTNKGNSPTKIAADMNATMHMQTLSSDEQGSKVAYALDVRRFTNNMMKEDLASFVRTELEEPFVVLYRPTGEVAEIMLPPAMDNKAGRIIRDIVSYLQFSRSDRNSWEATHDEPVGQALVDHRWLPGSRIRKEKLKMLKLIVGTRLMPTATAGHHPNLVSSTGILSLDSDGTILSAEIEEITEFSEQSVGFTSHSEVHVTLRRDNSRSSRSLAGIDMNMESRSMYNGASDVSEVNTPSRPLDEIINDMNASMESEDYKTLQGVQYELVNSLRQDTALLDKLLADSAKLNQPIIAAMVASGTPEAQKAMSEFIRDEKRDMEQRSDAIESFNFVPAPEQASIEALFSLTEDPELRGTALLAVGGTVAKQSEFDDNKAKGWLAKLIDMLNSAENDQERTQVLDSLGNTKHADAFDAIASMLEHENVEVRKSALRNLRWIPDPRVDPLLAANFVEGTTRDILEAALFAASYRSADAMVPPLSEFIQGKSPDLLREQAFHAVGGFYLSNSHEGARELLEWVVANDSNEELRKTAKQLLIEGKPIPPAE